MKTYNIYCDESAINNPDLRYMWIGGLVIERKHKKDLVRKIKTLKNTHNYNLEIKWNKVSPVTLPFYLDLVDLFLNNEIRYWSILVDKTEVNHEKYHKSSHEVAFWKFYYQLFKKRLQDDNEYYIYLDKRNTEYKDGVDGIKEFLAYESQMREKPFQIHWLWFFSSHEQILIQLSDLIIGAITHNFNEQTWSDSKKQVIEKLAKQLWKDNLHFCSKLYSDSKINNFCIRLSNG